MKEGRNAAIVAYAVLIMFILFLLFSVYSMIAWGTLGLILGAFFILITVAALIVHIYIWKKCHYQCPECGTKFKPSFVRSLGAYNLFDHRMMTCTNCRRHRSMKTLKDE
jgi:hypothetical protein